MVKFEEPKCKECGGIIDEERKPKPYQLLGFVAIGFAILICFAGAGLIIGIPLGFFGVSIAALAQKYSLCRPCHAMIQPA